MLDPYKICYLNGSFQDINSASIPVLDRGFIFGDAIYEVVPVNDGIAFLLTEHLQRLARNLSEINIQAPCSSAELSEIAYQLIAKNGSGNQSLYIQVSRGPAPRDHTAPKKAQATLFLFSSPLAEPSINPVTAISLKDCRWARCDIKSTSLLGNVLLRTLATEAGCQEAILFRDGKLTEGAASNVFVVLDGEIVTPPCSNQILPGITRQILLDIFSQNSVSIAERDIGEDQFRRASEVWLTSSSKDLVPVTHCDQQPIGDGKVGPIFTQANRLFSSFKLDWLNAEKSTRKLSLNDRETSLSSDTDAASK